MLVMTNKLVNQSEHMAFFKTALALRGSVTPKVIGNVILLTIYACIITYLTYIYPALALPIGPFEYGGLVLGLILVFRVNAGHDRWWEARKLWGNIVNQSRNLTMIIVNYTHTKDKNWLLTITNHIAALPYLIKELLRGNNKNEAIKHLMNDQTYEKLLRSENLPNTMSSIIAYELQVARDEHGLDPFAFIRAEEQREQLTNAQGACERILKTPMPFVMAIKIRRFILIFLLALPFGFVGDALYIAPCISGIVAYALLSLDQIGIELQNPFAVKNLSHLPLNEICKSIEENVVEIRKESLDRNLI
ncbi:MAG: hypothetical protein NXI01_02215 [Gammaproteobacteria bacterium]|nr:hypothetical protein [Gammaproteobacteria bacterium]